MPYWAAVFFIISLVAGLLGFGVIASASAGVAKILFCTFLILFLVCLIQGGAGRRRHL